MLSGNHLAIMGDLVSSMGDRSFASTYCNLFHSLLDIEECTVFSFRDSTNPMALLIEGRCEDRTAKAREIAADYVSGGYRSDPNIIDSKGELSVYATGIDRIMDRDYRARFYERPAVTHELVMLAQSGADLYYASFYRTGNAQSFDAKDVAMLGSLSGFIVKSLHKHNELAGSPEIVEECSALARAPTCEPRAETLSHLRTVLLNSPGKLSPREAEVCAGIVLGYSTLAISLNCKITPNTVATHRKRAYAKLGISSQNELFTRYFRAVRDFESRLALN